MFASPQPLHRGIGACVAGQVVPAETLDRQDLAPRQRRLGGGDGRVRADHRIGPGGVLQPQARAAVGAGDGLRVEAPIGGVVVLGCAGVAHVRTRAWSY